MRNRYVVLPCLVVCLILASQLLAQPAPQPQMTAAGSAAIPAINPALANPAEYVARQFGPSFKLDPSVPPMFGDLDGDGNEDLVLVGRCNTPMASRGGFGYKLADPYDAYFGNGNPKYTAQFTLHFDGSDRDILVVFGWRVPSGAKHKSKMVATKYVLINTPFESVRLVDLRYKKRTFKAIEAVDKETLHALIFWDGKRWSWHAQSMEGDEDLMPQKY